MSRTYLFRYCLKQCCQLNRPSPVLLCCDSMHTTSPSTRSAGSSISTLPCAKLPYNSIKVDLTEPEGWDLKRIEDFPSLLEASVGKWRSQNCSAIWLHVPVSLSPLISLASRQGFTLHHAKNQEVVMSRWLLEDKSDKLPPYASHQVGVSGVVYRDDTEEILVTQDKHKPPVWKFPGGLAECGEDIADAVKREIMEETGVDSEFQSIVAFRQQHRLITYHNLSDLYFICRMKPMTFDLQPCQDELVKCEWKKLTDLVACKDTTVLTQRVSKLLLEGMKDGFHTIDMAMEEWPMLFKGWAQEKTYKLFVRARTSNHS